MRKHHPKHQKGVQYSIEKVIEAVIEDVEEVLKELFPKRPQPPTRLEITFLGEDEMSKLAKVQLSWIPSASADVTKQVLTVTVGAGTPVVTELAAGVTTAGTFDVPQDTDVAVALVAVNDVGTSDKATLTFKIGALEVPAVPTGLAYKVTEVVDAPAPAPAA